MELRKLFLFIDQDNSWGFITPEEQESGEDQDHGIYLEESDFAICQVEDGKLISILDINISQAMIDKINTCKEFYEIARFMPFINRKEQPEFTANFIEAMRYVLENFYPPESTSSLSPHRKNAAGNEIKRMIDYDEAGFA
jgi:hypothetical protein